MYRLAFALTLVASAAHAVPIVLPWPVDGRPEVNAVAVDGNRAYLATGDDRAELLVVDLGTGRTLGSFDAEGSADALSVKLLAPGVVKLGRRRSKAPEVYRLDVGDPASIVVLGAAQRARTVRWKPDPIPPARFRDANGDGVFRLACLGDSNTVSVAGRATWCETLEGMIDDVDFEVVNLGSSGATVCPNLRFASDATQQMEEASELDVDAVVLAFGTNDLLQGRTGDEIVDAYVARAETAATAGIDVFVATIPPMAGCRDAGCKRIFWTDILLSFVFPNRTVNFFAGFTDEHFRVPDRLHLNDAGQALRAERALAVIGNPLHAGAARPDRAAGQNRPERRNPQATIR